MKTIYNNRIALLSNKQLVNLPEYIDLYQGKLQNAYFNLKSYELNTHQLYSHVLVTDNVNEIDLINLKTYDVSNNKMYCLKVNHSGFSPHCFVDLSTVLCSSWVLPFIVSKGCDYAFLRKHRVKMLPFDFVPKSLI